MAAGTSGDPRQRISGGKVTDELSVSTMKCTKESGAAFTKFEFDLLSYQSRRALDPLRRFGEVFHGTRHADTERAS